MGKQTEFANKKRQKNKKIVKNFDKKVTFSHFFGHSGRRLVVTFGGSGFSS